MTTSRFALRSLALGVTLLIGCSSDAADDTAVEPSRESRIQSLASASCDRYADTSAGCPGYGSATGQKYPNEDACENDFQQKAEDLWPVAKCGDGQIDAHRFDACLNRAQNYACSTGGQAILDAISALDECKADTVCIDPK